jgi:hypothetical protein
VSTSVVVGGILFSVNNLFGVVKLLVGTIAHFVTDRWLEIDVNSAGDMTTRGCLAEESVEGVVSFS